MELKVTHWPQETTPTEETLQEQLDDEELTVYHWSRPPQVVFDGHTHGYHKILYVISGSIKFDLPTRHEIISLGPGDRLDLPAGVRHIATVGLEGVKCMEAHIF